MRIELDGDDTICLLCQTDIQNSEDSDSENDDMFLETDVLAKQSTAHTARN